MRDRHLGRGNHIECVIVGQKVKSGYAELTGYNHYDLGATICLALGITPFAGFAAQTTHPITEIWYEGELGVPPAGGSPVTLSAPAPNPSRGGISARLWLPEATPIEARVHDLAGRVVRTIATGTRNGAVDLYWDGQLPDGSPAGKGVYFLTVRAGSRTLQRKAILLD
jgi:hypothetical protein